MTCLIKLSSASPKTCATNKNLALLALLFVIATGLSACGNKDKKAGQTLARVNGEDITVLQINDELRHANVQADQLENARKQLLESLIDRQLLIAEATRNKIDRTPDVMQSIERAKAQIIVQAYLQSIASKVVKPSKVEINDYYQKHPEFFSKRKEFDLKQIVIPNANFSDELKSAINSAKSLEDTAAWMDAHGVQYARGQVIRSTADLPANAVTKLLELPKGKMFLVSDGDNKVLSVVAATRERPVTAANAELQIERYLTNQKYKEAADQEIAHLRSVAKIEYLNASAPVAQTQVAPAGTEAVKTK